jgi:hypothetical protein
MAQQACAGLLLAAANWCNMTTDLVLIAKLQVAAALALQAATAAAEGGGDGCNSNGSSGGAAALQVNDCLRLHVC